MRKPYIIYFQRIMLYFFRQNHYLTFAYRTSPDSTKIAASYELDVKGW